MTRPTDLDRSLEELENDKWGPAPPDATRMITTVHALRRQPIGTMTAEDLRLLISQDVGVEHLLPLALARLDQDPLTEGDMYPGALLAAVLRVSPGFWADHRDHAARLTTILAVLADPPAVLKPGIDDFTRRSGLSR